MVLDGTPGADATVADRKPSTHASAITWRAREPWWRSPGTWWLTRLTAEAAAGLETASATGDGPGALGRVVRALDQPIVAPLEAPGEPPHGGVVVFDSNDMTALLVETTALEGEARNFALRAAADGHRVLAVLENDV